MTDHVNSKEVGNWADAEILDVEKKLPPRKRKFGNTPRERPEKKHDGMRISASSFGECSGTGFVLYRHMGEIKRSRVRCIAPSYNSGSFCPVCLILNRKRGNVGSDLQLHRVDAKSDRDGCKDLLCIKIIGEKISSFYKCCEDEPCEFHTIFKEKNMQITFNIFKETK